MSYDRYAEVLKSRGLKSADVTRLTGIQSGVFSEWKNGKYNPKRDKILKIAEALDCNPDYLEGTSDQMEKEAPAGYYVDAESLRLAQQILENREYKALFDASQKLKPDDIKFIIEMIERMS